MADTKVCTENRIAFQDVKGVVLLERLSFRERGDSRGQIPIPQNGARLVTSLADPIEGKSTMKLLTL